MTRAGAFIGHGRKRVAVIGTGISGLLAAERLATKHDVVVFEADSRIGGHTHTVDVQTGDGALAIDTGFIVCNDRTYPGFLGLMSRLDVPLRASTMSFSMHCEASGVEYCGSSFDGLFAQRRNLLRPSFWSMLGGIRRFHRLAESFRDSDCTLAQLLKEARLDGAFARWYLMPMMAAIWSAKPEALASMPARFFIRFFSNHGMLQVKNRPQWQTVVGGSRSYLGPLSRTFSDRIRLNAPVVEIRRQPEGVLVRVKGGEPESFDAVVLATHSDQALRMIADASDAEQSLLSAIPYQANDVVLHTDTKLMPERRKAWSAWNYRLPASPNEHATVTYDMNILQGFETPERYLVSLNSSESIDPQKVLRRFSYDHPVFDQRCLQAQAKVGEVSGTGRIWFCGAWCGFGFHEDGVQSALRVAADFGVGNGGAHSPVAARAMLGVAL
ncbi:MAG: putative NAD/FAD-binding protein [Neolewinella sp.]|jgi:predicted NAD/FAD-binding protein